MCFTIDQIERACGLLLLTEFNTFVYCCKGCQCEFESGSNLEVHILSEHQDSKENVFVHESVFVDNLEIRKTVKEEQFVVNTEVLNEPNVEEQTVDDVKPLTILMVNENLDNDNNSIETNKVKDEVPFDELTEEHLEENFEPKLNNMEFKITHTVSKRSKTDVDPIEKLSKIRISKTNSDDTAKTKISQEPISFYCDMCPNQLFKYKQSLIKHMNAHHIYTQFKCNYCDAKFTQNGSKVIHMRTHTGEKPFSCSICGKAFISKSRCSKHETQVHQKVKTIRPRIASKPPNQNQNPVPVERFHCEMCPNLSFKYKQSLQRHIIRHAVKEMKRCEICNKLPRKSYEHHMKMKHSDHRFKCDHCDAQFKHNTTRVIHMRTHTGEKPFLCSTCGKAFNSKSRCYSHETSVHQLVKKHQCQQCDRSFNTRGFLQDHINAIHTKERPHVCDVCGKNYASKSTLQVHKFTHGEARLKCRYCDVSFKLRNNRWEHEMVFHKKVVMVGDKIVNMYKKKNRLKMEMQGIDPTKIDSNK